MLRSGGLGRPELTWIALPENRRKDTNFTGLVAIGTLLEGRKFSLQGFLSPDG